MILPFDPTPPPDLLPIVDPGYHLFNVTLFLSFGLPWLACSLVMEDLMSKFFTPFTLYRIGMRLGIFTFLTALPLYYYPAFHQWYVWNIASQTNNEFWMGLTVYNPLRYGGIHMPTFVLMFLFAMAAVTTPYVARLTESSVESLARRIQTDWRNRHVVEDNEPAQA